jgi:hypothetical protein
MNVTDKIEGVREYPKKASEEFRQQLERARAALDKMDGQVPSVKGIDRSGELTPLPRPTIVRVLVPE